jgi:hypothetical protein
MEYMNRIETNPSRVAKKIGLDRRTVYNWIKENAMPKKENRDKVIACAEFFQLTDEKTNEFLKAAGFDNEVFPPNDLVKTIFADYIEDLFTKLRQFNPHPIMLLLTQANWSEPPCRDAILLKAKTAYSENVLHIHPPVSLSVDADSYFAELGQQCGMECVKNDFDFEKILKKRVENGNSLFLLVSRFEQGVPSLGKRLASIVRDISEMYSNHFHVMLCGGEKLVTLKYENGNLSLLNLAKEEYWPELGRKEVYALCQHRFPNLDLEDVLVDKLLEISGGHPQLLDKCLEFQSSGLNSENYPEKLSQCSEVLQLFTPYKKTRIHEQWDKWLKQDKLAGWQPYILDDVLRELYWKNALVKRDNDGEIGLYWRCEAIRMAGKKILGGG